MGSYTISSSFNALEGYNTQLTSMNLNLAQQWLKYNSRLGGIIDVH